MLPPRPKGHGDAPDPTAGVEAPAAPRHGDADGAAEMSLLERRAHQDDVRSAGFFWACLIFTVDQATKWAMLHVLELDRTPKVALLPFLDLTLVWNPGISYGLFPQDTELGRWTLVAFTLVASGLVLYWLLHAHNRLLSVSLGLVLGGALGNLVDRFAYGAVVDFVHFHTNGVSWYVFNVADAAIVLGVVGLIADNVVGMVRGRHPQASVNRSDVASDNERPRRDAARPVE